MVQGVKQSLTYMLLKLQTFLSFESAGMKRAAKGSAWMRLRTRQAFSRIGLCLAALHAILTSFLPRRMVPLFPPQPYPSFRLLQKETHYAKEFAEPLAPSDPLFRFKETARPGDIAFDGGDVRSFASTE